MVELFRAALPHKQAQWDERISGKDTLTLEDRLAGQRCAGLLFQQIPIPHPTQETPKYEDDHSTDHCA